MHDSLMDWLAGHQGAGYISPWSRLGGFDFFAAELGVMGMRQSSGERVHSPKAAAGRRGAEMAAGREVEIRETIILQSWHV